jgi:hypothetical protein
VPGEQPVPAGHHLGERDQLVVVGGAHRRVDQPGGQADGAVVETVGHQPEDPVALGRRRRPAIETDDTRPHRAVRDERRHVAGRPGPLDGRQVSRDVGPVQLQLRIEIQIAGSRADLGGGGGAGAGWSDWSDTQPAVPDDLRRHPLPDRAVRRRVGQQGQIGMGVDVDEAGSDHQPGHVDDAAAGRRRPQDQPAAADTDIDGARGRTGTVIDDTAREHHVHATTEHETPFHVNPDRRAGRPDSRADTRRCAGVDKEGRRNLG